MSDKEFMLNLAGIFAQQFARAQKSAEDYEAAASRARADADQFNMYVIKLFEKACNMSCEDADKTKACSDDNRPTIGVSNR